MTHSSRGPFRIVSSKEVYRNPWIRVREDQVIRPSGDDGIFGIVEMVAGSTVLAMNDEYQAYVVKEYKYAVERETIELMSGGLEEGETPLQAAKRELKEELGLEAVEWIDFGIVDPFTTVVRSPNHMFLALGVSEGRASPDDGEILKISRIGFDQLVEMVMSGEITHSASCVLVLKAHIYLERMKMSSAK